MDILKANLAIGSAQKQLELLEQAIEQYNYKAIADALHNAKRELSELKRLIEPKPKLERSAEFTDWSKADLLGIESLDCEPDKAEGKS